MADHDQEARLRDLKERVEREPGSRFFVPLAEEYRKAGRVPDAIKALESGLAVHPAYVAARVALARAYLEVGRIDESMQNFSKALVDDPSNLVAAKALGDIHLSRGEPMEALKRYLRFRAVSGDRRMDEVIAKLREASGPPPDAAPARALAPASAPPTRIEPAEAPAPLPLMVSPFPAIDLSPPPPPRRETDPFDITSVPYAPPPKPGPVVSEPAEQMLSRDVRLDGIPSRDASADEEIVTRKIRLPETAWPFVPAPEEPPLPDAAVGPPEATAPAEPAPAGEPVAAEVSGRTLAELYFEQGHAHEALHLADELLLASPGDERLLRLRDEAADRLAVPAPAPVPPPVGDAGRERRLEKIRLLNQWLAAVQKRSRP